MYIHVYMHAQALQEALDSGDFSPVFTGNVSKVSQVQLVKLATQTMALLRYYKALVSEPYQLNKQLYENIAKSMEVTISQWAIRSWVIDFENDQGKIRESLQGRWQRRWILNEEDLRARAINFFNKCEKRC